MATDYKPLFNPLYLRALILILPMLIILLASLGPDDAQYPAIHHNGAQRLSWIEQPQRPDNELRLLLPTPLALNPEQRIIQQTLARLLQQRLQQPATQTLLAPVQDSSVMPRSDHLQISLRWPAGEAMPALDVLRRALYEAPEPGAVTSTLARTRAQAYIEGQEPAQRLLNHLQQQLQPGDNAPAATADVLQQFHQLLDQSPMLVMGGPDAAQMAEQLIAWAPARADKTDRTENSQPAKPHSDTLARRAPLPSRQPTRLQLSDPRQPTMYLQGTRMPGRGADTYAAELLAISSLQRALALRPDETQGRYRLVWQSSRDGGYRALIMDGQPTTRADMLDVAVINDALIDAARQQLLSELSARLQTPKGQLDQLATLAFNNLNGQRLDSILEQLQAVPGDDIGPIIAQYLAPETQILITLNAQ